MCIYIKYTHTKKGKGTYTRVTYYVLYTCNDVYSRLSSLGAITASSIVHTRVLPFLLFVDRKNRHTVRLLCRPRTLTVDRYRVISAADFRVMSLTRPRDDTLHFRLSRNADGKSRNCSMISEGSGGTFRHGHTRVPFLFFFFLSSLLVVRENSMMMMMMIFLP